MSRTTRTEKSFEAYGALPKPLWAVLLVIDAVVFLLGFFSGELGMVLLAFVMTLLLDVLGRRGLLRGFGGQGRAEAQTPTITRAQYGQIVQELRAQRAERRRRRTRARDTQA